MHAEQGSENRAEILFGSAASLVGERIAKHLKEFLDDLVADHAFLGRKALRISYCRRLRLEAAFFRSNE